MSGRKDEMIRSFISKKASSENPPPNIGTRFFGEAFFVSTLSFG